MKNLALGGFFLNGLTGFGGYFLFFLFFHFFTGLGFLEVAYAFPDGPSDLRQLTHAEDDKDNGKDKDNLPNAETLKHVALFLPQISPSVIILASNRLVYQWSPGTRQW